jgi:site-specific recombinase XerD
MAQATTLTDAQFKRALRYCQARRHVTRDTTILLFSLHTGLRAVELAALRVGDVYGDDGAPRKQFTLSKFQTKGASPRAVFVNKQLTQQLVVYGKWRHCSDSNAPLFPCASCSSTYSLLVDCKVLAVTVDVAPSSHAWPTRVLVCVCLLHWLDTVQ